MSSPLIFIPKKLTQDVDFSPHLRQVISRNYSESPDSYSEQLSTLNRSRQDALRGSAGSDITGRDLLHKYFGQLELLELRFPELRVPFPWNDAFTQKQISQLSLAYEKASVIFNIGATLSSLAASSPRTSPEGLKRAMYSFRCASGMFTYINDNFLHAPSTDLSREVVKVLIVLMGAQATEIFIEMTKGVGLKSKLCMSVSSMYSGIIEEVKEWSTKGVFIKDWYYLIQTKAKYFGSLAQFYRSTADITASKYGDSLARLFISETLAKEALVLSKQFSSSFGVALITATSLAPDSPSTMLELTKTHLSLVTETKLRCQKENDLVYNDVIPSEASLTPIEKAKDVAEPVPIHDVYSSAEVQKIVGPDLFLKLVPLSVHESASMYSEEKAKLVRAEAERVDLAEGELMAALEYLGLPASLERFKSGAAGQNGLTDPGGQVRTWAEEIRSEESRNGRLEDSFIKLESLKSKAGNELERSGRDLETEARECELMRVKFGHLWEQDPSSSMTRSYRQDLRSHRDSLEQAASSDAVARGIWEGIRRDINTLIDPRALERTFVEAVGSGQTENLLDVDLGAEEEDEESKKKVAAIGEALSKLSKIKKERSDILKDLKERVQNDDISSVLILNRKGSSGIEPSIFATELEKFRPHQNRITATLQHQESTLAEIVADFKYINEGKGAREMQDRWGSAERQKKELISRLGRAREAYSEVRVGLQKGIQFYQDLTELIEGLSQQVSSFLSMRNTERNQMASSADIKQRLDRPRISSPPALELDRRMGGLDLGGNRSPPPQQPMMPPQQPSWTPQQPQRQPSYSSAPPPQSVYSSAQSPQSVYSNAPPTSPYQNFPSTGAFAASPPPSNPYSSPPPPASFSQPPPPVSQYQQYPSYSQPSPPQQQRQSSFPPPPQPLSTPSYLPPPPPPVSYSTQAPPPLQYQPQQPSYPQYQQQQPQYGQPPPPPPQQQQQYGNQPPPPPQQQQQYGYGYQSPPPPRPNY